MDESKSETHLKRGASRPLAVPTIIDVIRNRAEQEPHHTALLFLEDGEHTVRCWSYQELWTRVRDVAERVQSLRGERVVLLYDAGLEYIAAFLGVLAAGAVAVPSYPPAGRRAAARLLGIMMDCAPAAVLTTTSWRALLASRLQAAPGLRVVTSDDDPQSVPDFEPEPLRSGAVAMLQYTSGSTGAPKGVVVTHGNILANCDAIYRWLGPDPERVGSIWLPPFHDMGLLGGVLEPLYAGFPLVFMSPLHFVQRPYRWLRAMSDYRVTLSGAPDFAYESCVRTVTEAELETLDLRAWRQAFCGAEPVRPRTHARFVERFGRVGFQASAYNPCYGLAEATLLVSGKPAGTAPIWRSFSRAALHGAASADASAPEDTTLMSSGVPAHGLCVKIVDPETSTALPDGSVGEIWVAGDSVALGYWNKPEQTRATFHGQLPGDSRSYLRTGDLGLFREGQLFVTGRIKDLVIVAGRNHFAEDIEATVQSAHAALEPATVVAFAYEANDAETLAIVVEPPRSQHFDEPTLEQLRAAVVASVTEMHGVSPSTVHFCRYGSVPRTTSGKTQRLQCRDWFVGTVARDPGRPGAAAPQASLP